MPDQIATRLLALVLLFATAAGQAIEPQVETIVVRSQPAAALVDVVRPLLGQDGGVSAFHDKLIVRGSPQQIAAVRSLLADLDRPARRLIIEVRQSGGMTSGIRDFGYGARTDDVRIGQAPRRDGVGLYYRDLQTRGRDDGTQRVQALDGRPSLIRTGQSVPIYNTYQHGYGGYLVQGFDVVYRDAISGFVALPRVHGDQVTVEIYQQHERAAPSDRFDLQHASTVLRGGLGQWLTLGSTGGSVGDNRNELGRHLQTHRTQDRVIELRVIAVD